MNDEKIIGLYLERNEDAIPQTKKKYGRLALSVIGKILGKEDSEECENDTYLKIWNSIPPDKPDNFRAYLCRIARNIALNRLRYNSTDRRDSELAVSLSELEEIVPDRTKVSDSELGDMLTRFLYSQKPVVRNVFIRKYWFFDSVSEISLKYGFSEDKVKSMLYRTRKALKDYLEKEDITL